MSLSQQLKEEEGVDQPILPVSTVPVRRKNKKRQIVNPSQNTGHWSQQEHQTYLDFLQQNQQIMESQDQKKSNKIFKQMSEIIGSRSPSQCRSHHQKFNPFIHQVKKRQKGAGRKRKDNQITQPIQHLYHFYQQPIISQHQLDFPIFQPPYPEEMIYPQPITSDRSLLYNFGFLPQFSINFNYYNDLLFTQYYIIIPFILNQINQSLFQLQADIFEIKFLEINSKLYMDFFLLIVIQFKQIRNSD
ncbi:unnamed protein product [Paramecium pentaurelia]|uniref:Myb-like domain-containing protein n=1 Tax=Paramecium pentaurelia TaxID=43138 RepID=A0A8S1Y209_9CILI|nr:unnamed protein product [Paramecium pentaurelia]